MPSPANSFKRLTPGSLQSLRVVQAKEAVAAPNTPATAIFVELDAAHSLELFVEVELKAPGQDKLFRAIGKIEWLNATPAEGQPQGLGIRIISVESDGKSAPSAAKDAAAASGQEAKAAPAGGPAAASGPVPAKDGKEAATETAAAATTDGRPAASASGSVAAAVTGNNEIPLPPIKDVQEMLGGLFGNEVTISPGESPLSSENVYTGYIIDDKGALKALWTCDFDFAVRAGAALSMIPATEVDALIKEKQVSKEAFGNLKEIINVGTALFNQNGSAHLKLKEVYEPASTLPEECQKLLATPAARLDLTCKFESYGQGKMCLLVA